MLKVSDNPPMIWPEETPLAEFQGTWWVAHTKSRNEKALAQDLRGKEIAYFLPMHWQVRRKKGRTFKSLLPLFTGYLFFCGNEPDRIEVLRTNRVANLLEVKDQQQLVCELSQFEQTIRSGANLSPHPYLKKGQRCRVTGGPLADLQGIVERIKGATQLILQIDMLGQAASVEIETDMIETLDE